MSGRPAQPQAAPAPAAGPADEPPTTAQEKKKEKWYPGKKIYEVTQEEGWYPGKKLIEAAKELKETGDKYKSGNKSKTRHK